MPKKREIKSAPHFDGYLQVAQSQPIVVEQDIKEHLLLVYEKMSGVEAPGAGTERRPNHTSHSPATPVRIIRPSTMPVRRA